MRPMLDPKVIELVDRRVRVHFEEREGQLQEEINHARDLFAMHGSASSGPAFKAVYDLCAHDIEIRALIVWQNINLVLSRAGIDPSDSLAQDLKKVVQNYYSAIYSYPAQRWEKVASTSSLRLHLELGDAWERALRKVENEIDLFVLSLRRASKEQQPGSPQPVFHISSVGAIQTGPSATANIVMNIAPGDREELLRALDAVKEALSPLQALPAHPISEVIELVDEAKVEIGKPKPNGMRLGSVLLAVATAIQAVGSLQPAYQTLKAALLSLGIPLP